MDRERSFPKEIPSLDAIFTFLDEFFAAEAITGTVTLSLSLVVEELFTNLVKYNRSAENPVSIRLERLGKEARIELVDRDVDRFDPSTLPPVDLEAPMAQRQAGGLGLHLVRAIVDRITFEYHDRVLRIVVSKKLEPDHA